MNFTGETRLCQRTTTPIEVTAFLRPEPGQVTLCNSRNQQPRNQGVMSVAPLGFLTEGLAALPKYAGRREISQRRLRFRAASVAARGEISSIFLRIESAAGGLDFVAVFVRQKVRSLRLEHRLRNMVLLDFVFGLPKYCYDDPRSAASHLDAVALCCPNLHAGDLHQDAAQCGSDTVGFF